MRPIKTKAPGAARGSDDPLPIMAPMACPICEKRKSKRFCPAKNKQICQRCCGEQREVTIICPFDCRYLQQSRERDYSGGLDPKDFPYEEIRIDESFLRDHARLVETCGKTLLEASLSVTGTVDADSRAALDGLIRTYKTRESGLYYDSRPDSIYAARIFDELSQRIEHFRREEQEQSGIMHTRDSDVLTTWVFLLRMALDRDNGRPKGRAFLDFLHLHFRPAEDAQSPVRIVGR